MKPLIAILAVLTLPLSACAEPAAQPGAQLDAHLATLEARVAALAEKLSAVSPHAALPLTPGRGAAGNSAKLEAALVRRGPVELAPGYWAVDNTIELPGLTGLSITGHNMSQHSVEGQYARGHGGPATRLVWEGPAGGAMLRAHHAWGLTLDGLHFDGLAEGGESRRQAKVGIHYEPQAVKGGGPLSSQMNLGRVSFHDLPVAILAGRDTVPADAAGDINGEADLHADCLSAQHLYFTSSVKRCLWVRTRQAVGFNIQWAHWSRLGGGDDIDDVMFYFERGGKFHCSHAGIMGDGTLLRIGKSNVNSATFSFGNVIIDNSANEFRLLQCDVWPNTFHGPFIASFNNFVLPSHDYMAAEEEPGFPAMNGRPIIDCNGRGGVIVLNKGIGLRPGSVRINGAQHTGRKGFRQVVHLTLENCILVGCDNPADLLHADSLTLYRMSWRNCVAFWRDGDYLAPLADGAADSGDLPGQQGDR